MTGPAVPDDVRDPRPWWKRPGQTRPLAVVYVVLGLGMLVGVVLFGMRGGLVLALMWLVAGGIRLLRSDTTLRHGVLKVPVRWFGRRRVPVTDIASFATPHPLDPALVPSAVLRDGTRLLLRDVDATLLATWSDATGIPVVRDPKPAPSPPSHRAALS